MPLVISKIPVKTPCIKLGSILKFLKAGEMIKTKAFIQPEVYNLIPKSTKTIDIMKKEELTILNIIATAEGAIEIAI